jgi:SecD/SecF fusion protein
MSEKHLNQRLLLIGAVLLIGVIVIYPPQKKLRPGLDIAGGVSMIFEIDDTGMEDNPDLAEQMKTLLQRRVDPSGVMSLIWRVHGRNRIEVQMPLPPPQAKALREEYLRLEDELFAHNLKRSRLEAALAEPEPQRTAALAAIAEQTEASMELLATAAQRYDAYTQARAALEAATVPAAPEALASAPVELELAARDAGEALDDALAAVLATNLDERRFRDVLEMEPTSKVRAASLDSFRQQHPRLAAQMEKVIEAHARWRDNRGFLDGPADLRRLLSGAGVLEWRILAEYNPDNPTQWDRYREQLEKFGPRPQRDDLAHWFKIDNPLAFFNLDSPAALAKIDPKTYRPIVVEKYNEEWYVLARSGPEYELLGDVKRKWQLKRASSGRDEFGRPSVHFEFDARGGDAFRRLTGRNVKRQLAIFVDGVAYSHATIQEAIGASGRITGDFNQEKVRYLVNTMLAGALPARLKETPLSERTIGSSLGQTNLQMAVRSGVIGLVGTVLVITVYYMISGGIAILCMLMNVFLTLAVLGMLGARFTLDAIAGLILSLGMAVDANVLIYERMREEKARGSSLRMIVKNGYDKALSTIIDSNLTTLLTCVIIYYAGSEEIKGFGLTLGWGIVLNLFTAVFVSRTLFTLLLKYNVIREVNMLKLIGVPGIDWMRLSRVLVPATTAVMLLGLVLLYLRGPDNTLDVEFLGGVSAEVEVAPDAPVNDVILADRLRLAGEQITAQGQKLAAATVEPVGGDPSLLRVRVPGVPAARLAAMLTEPLEERRVRDPDNPRDELPLMVRGGVTALAGGDFIDVRVSPGVTAPQLQQIVRGLAGRVERDGINLGRANVGAVLETGGVAGRFWNVTTTVANKALVQDALVAAVGEHLVIQPRITYALRGMDGRPYPVLDRRLDSVVPGAPPGTSGDLTDFRGGAAIHLDEIEPPQALELLEVRLKNMRLQPGYQDYPWREFRLFGVRRAERDGQPRVDAEGRPLYSSVVIAVVDQNLVYQDDPTAWATRFAEKELALVKAALDTEQTLRKVSQFKPQIAAQSQTQALIAILLAWLMIIGYMWVRFGSVRYGFAGVIALVHDVLIALAFVGISGWIGGTRHPIGQALLIEDFKIDMTIIAALLTLVGYSINDKIVIFDRIRELRGRHGQVNAATVNAAVNQTFPRTLMTGITVMLVLLVMYIFGGSGIRGFSFCMLIGVITGTYSSIAVASPMLLFRAQQRGLVRRPAGVATAG